MGLSAYYPSKLELISLLGPFFSLAKLDDIMEQKKEFLENCLAESDRAKASFAEARIFERLTERIHMNTGSIETAGIALEEGFNIRIILEGAWGYAASSRLTKDEISTVVEQAIEVAKASSQKLRKPVELTTEPIITDSYATPCKIDPFDASFEEKLELVKIGDSAIRESSDQIRVSTSWLDSYRVKLLFANSEGTRIAQEQTYVRHLLSALAVGTDVQQRSSADCQMKGFEYAKEIDFDEEGRRIAKEALLLINEAKNCPITRTNFILEPSQLGLTIHESTGHPTELDRVMQFEADLAGTSFLTLDKFRSGYKYGSGIVNIICDPALPDGLGSTKYDDEGVRTKKFHVIKDGIFENYMTDRELANELGYANSFGNARISNYNRIPLIRMGNLHLEPDPQGPNDIDELIAETKDGIYALSWKSHSIDDKRVNFQFSTQIGWKIENGELTQPLKNISYNAATPEFWGSCDMITKSSRSYGAGPICAKGIPMQLIWVSHGGGWARFNDVNVFAG